MAVQPLRITKLTEIFTTMQEQPCPTKAEVTGTLPQWLEGSLLRVGPGKFEWGETSYRHWFDGEALIHRFNIRDGTITYCSSYLRSQSYLKSQAKCQIQFATFGTMEAPDPCKNIFARFMSYFVPPKRTDNANISIVPMKGKNYASTEINPVLIHFDPETLITKDHVNVNKRFPGRRSWLAHPHLDNEENYYNCSTAYVDKEYQVITIPYKDEEKDQDGETIQSSLNGARILTRIPFSGPPAYYHSFGMTKNYFILIENPFYIKSNKIKMLSMKITQKSFLDLIKWDGSKLSKIHLIDRRTGQEQCVYTADPFFTFHHINAYEEDDAVIVDLCGYDDSRIVFQFYLHGLRFDNPDITTGGKGFAPCSLRRYRLPLDKVPDKSTGSIRLGRRKNGLDYETLHMGFEMPNINYDYNGVKYRFAYGNGQSRPGAYFNQLIKVDIETRKKCCWQEEDCYPSEPCYVASPQAMSEDDGVILSAVIGVRGKKSFLLVLDAVSFTEIARAEIPCRMAATLHGGFWR